jgi:alkylhydroperoxidase/carboxymuconolactone decarboxylase family protein YurZ
MESTRMAGYKQTLRRLAVGDDRTDLADPASLDCRTRAFAQLGAMFALGAGAASYRAGVEDAVAAGATYDEIVDALVAVMPIAGAARVTATAPQLGLALGYDIDAALEALDDGHRHPAAES